MGWNSNVGMWSRVEGSPNDPNPNKPFAKLENPSLFDDDGKLNPAITVIGEYFHTVLEFHYKPVGQAQFICCVLDSPVH